MRALAFFALSSAVFCGCYLTSDLDGLTGGTETPLPTDDAAPDAFTPPKDAGGSDAPADAPADAPIDFCAGALFCDQFDQTGRGLADGWGHFDQGAASAGIVTDAYSAPRAFGLSVPQSLAGDQATSALFLDSTFPPSMKLHIEMRLKLSYSAAEQWDPNAYLPLVTFLADNSDYFGSLAAVPNGLNLGTQKFYSDGGLDQLITNAAGSFAGRWLKIAIDETFSPTAGHIRFEIDGTVFIDADLPTARSTPFSKLTVIVGAASSNGHTPKMDVVYDDFLIR